MFVKTKKGGGEKYLLSKFKRKMSYCLILYRRHMYTWAIKEILETTKITSIMCGGVH
jgi:hypothetical protein